MSCAASVVRFWESSKRSDWLSELRHLAAGPIRKRLSWVTQAGVGGEFCVIPLLFFPPPSPVFVCLLPNGEWNQKSVPFDEEVPEVAIDISLPSCWILLMHPHYAPPSASAFFYFGALNTEISSVARSRWDLAPVSGCAHKAPLQSSSRPGRLSSR